MKTLFPTIHRGAEFSPCQKYRYRLWRQWGEGRPLCMLMLNPSRADCEKNDPTVERQQRRAVQLGFDGLIVVNLFAFRSTDPAIMLAQADPVGPDNDAAILRAVSEAGMTICAWGTDGGHRGRSAAVLKLLAGRELHCLVRCKDGEPGHPLYVGYGVLPVVFQAGE